MNEYIGEEPAQHHEFALGEVNDLGDSVNYGESQPNQGINAARGDAAYQ